MRPEPQNIVYFKDSQLQNVMGITMLKDVFINLNPCCVQWYKFHVHRGKGSGDGIYPFKNMVDFIGSQLHI